jgi:hypothetical protein
MGAFDAGLFDRHLARLRSSLSAHSHDTICDFITEHTYIRGQRFSFTGHEYQRKILEDKSQNIVILKSAQIGISEMSARLALARAVLVTGFSTIYTLPSATAAQNFMKTRMDPVIDSSPYLSELVSKEVDNASVKRFGDSYVYCRGAQVDRQAISIPADLLVVDEVDNSNQDVITLYESRLIHSSYALTIKLSTPTIPGFGIDMAYKQSRRHLNMCKCSKCNEWFYPEYDQHVVVPGFDDKLENITKSHFANPNFKWYDAYVACPRCGSKADLGPMHREWVIENPEDAFIAAGYRISPFDCPSIIKPSALVKSSVDYARKQDFYNQRLGVPLEDKEASLDKEELEKVLVSEGPHGFSRVMGLDMGMTCWCTICDVLPDDTLVIVHIEGIPLYNVIARRKELAAQYRVRMTVVDHGPYTETVYRMQQESPNIFAGVYVRSKAVELFKVKDVDEDKEKGKQSLQQVNISRDRVFDLIMSLLRNGGILKVSCTHDDLWKEHLTDQKRVREFQQDELVFVWVKTNGLDHLHHSLLYALVASRMLGVAAGCHVRLPMMGSFKTKSRHVGS